MRYFIDLSYDGTLFHGWQKQNNAVTVQGVVEDCLARIYGRRIDLTGAGRTDTGVHARQLPAHFDTEEKIDLPQLVYKLNRMLPQTVAVNKIYQVRADAHARFDAVTRTYQYQITTKKDPFKKTYYHYLPFVVDVEIMNRACQILKTQHDFQCFSKVRTDVKTYICTLKEVFWMQDGDNLIFTITADRFLRDMVRAIVGTLLEIGAGKRTLKDLELTLKSKNRGKAGQSVAANGLFLCQVSYPKSILTDHAQ